MNAEGFILVVGAVTMLVQGVKKLIEQFRPEWSTTKLGVGLNLAISLAGVITMTSPENLFSLDTLTSLLTVVFGSAGLHNLLKRS